MYSIGLVGSTLWASSGAFGEWMPVYDKATGAMQRKVQAGINHADSILYDGHNVWTALHGNGLGTATLTVRQADVNESPHVTNNVDYAHAMVFDGTSIWLGGESSLTRFDTQTGLATGNFPTPFESGQAMAFDGTYLWLTSKAGTVSRFLASDGTLQGTFPAGPKPKAMVFDGTDLWIVNVSDPISGPGTLHRLSVATGALLATYPLPENPSSIAFDGTDLFVGYLSGWVQIERTAGATVASCDNMATSVSRQVVADGTALWVTSPDRFFRY